MGPHRLWQRISVAVDVFWQPRELRFVQIHRLHRCIILWCRFIQKFIRCRSLIWNDTKAADYQIDQSRNETSCRSGIRCDLCDSCRCSNSCYNHGSFSRRTSPDMDVLELPIFDQAQFNDVKRHYSLVALLPDQAAWHVQIEHPARWRAIGVWKYCQTRRIYLCLGWNL